jgi:hypothetical protein
MADCAFAHFPFPVISLGRRAGVRPFYETRAEKGGMEKLSFFSESPPFAKISPGKFPVPHCRPLKTEAEFIHFHRFFICFWRLK